MGGGSALVAAVALLVYGVGQQAARRAIDDGPRALLQQTRAMLAAEVPPSVAAARPTVDLATSDAPFVIIYDAEHSVLSSSATISGSVPHLPPGVLDEASARGEDRVTWQPAAAVREAVVAGPWQSATARGVVVAGISLAATEDRTAKLRNWVGLAWLLVELALTATLTVAAGSVPARSTQSATIAPPLNERSSPPPTTRDGRTTDESPDAGRCRFSPGR